MLLSLVAIALFPRSYESDARLLIRVGRESVSLDPTATTGETIMLMKSQLDEVNSALNLITSRDVLSQAVAQVGPERILGAAPNEPAATSSADPNSASQLVSDGRSWLSNALIALRLSDPVSIEERAIRKLEKGLKVTNPKESTVLNIRYKASSPQLAQEVVAAVSSGFLDEHLRLSQSEGSLGFFMSQTEKLHQELTAAQTKLRDQMNAFQLTTAGGRRSILEKTEEAMRQKLYELEIQENDLKTRYTDEYPVLREIRRQRADTERRLTEIAKNRSQLAHGEGQETTQPDSADESELYSELKWVNDQEFKIAQLQREVGLLENKYGVYKGKLEQARVNEAMDKEEISNVKVAQSATLVERPVAPNKALILALGTLAGLFGAVGLAFLCESMDQTLRTTDQVESELGLPVLMTVPNRAVREALVDTVDKALAASQAVANASSEKVDERDLRYRGLVRALLTNGNGRGTENDRRACTIGVVGCESTNFRSRIATNLAIEAARSMPNPVLLIDADDRHRAVTNSFHINGSPGLREFLAGSADTESCVHRQSIDNLAVMSPGSPYGDAQQSSATPVEAQPNGRFNQMMSGYRMVVVDLPADGELDLQAPSAGWLNETVLVVEAEQTRIQSAQRAKTVLERSGVHVAGVVLAGRREHIPRWLYQRL